MRLTCPLLVSAIDELEKDGAIERYNERLTSDPAWRDQLAKVNEAHRLLRMELVSDRPEVNNLRESYGEENYQTIFAQCSNDLRTHGGQFIG